MRSEVDAVSWIAAAALPAPLASATRVTSRRAARNLAMVRNRSRPQAGGFASAQIGYQGGQHGGQLLGFAGARLVVGPPVGQQSRDVRHGARIGGQPGGDLQGARRGVGERSGPRQRTQRVAVEGAAALVLADAGGTPDLQQAAGGLQRALRSVQSDGRAVESHPAQGRGKGRRMVGEARLAGGLDLQQHRSGAGFEVLQNRPVGGLRVALGVALAHVPAAGIPAAAAHGGCPRHRLGARVERLDGQAVAGRGDQTLAEIGALQHLLDQR
jgi:hypothetical protein